MIVPNVQTEMNEKKNTVSKFSDTVTLSSTDATTVSPNNTVTEEAEAPILWRLPVMEMEGFRQLLRIHLTQILFTENDLAVPTYEGKIFAGWYVDVACTIPFDRAEGENANSLLYAGWKTETYMLSDRGYLIDCGPELVSDGLLLLPSDGSCTGVEAHAFDKLAQMVEEIYIPANITYIAPEAFENLTNLIYIEVAPNNPVYYSVNGELYMKDGDHLVK